jgi:hypothetical protein
MGFEIVDSGLGKVFGIDVGELDLLPLPFLPHVAFL